MIKLVRDRTGNRWLCCCDLRVVVPRGRTAMVAHVHRVHGITPSLARAYVTAVLQPKKRRTWWGEHYDLFAQGQGEAPACAVGEGEDRDPPASAAVLEAEE